MERKNTLLLTIIAVATLLVAVVGATFAYFTATGAASDASEVTVTTSSVDAITSTVGSVTLPVTLADMQETNGANDYSKFKSASGFIESQIAPGTDTAVRNCTYDIVYTPTDVFTNSATNVTNLNELTIQGTGIQDGDTANPIDTIAETSLSGINAETNLGSDLTFSYAGGAQTVVRWNFEVRFYNLAIDQSANAGRTFGGDLVIDNISCVTT